MLSILKGFVAPDFVGPFWAPCIGQTMKRSLWTPSIFGSYFKVFKRLLPKHLRDSWNFLDGSTNVEIEVLGDFLYSVFPSLRFPIFFSENCWQMCKFFFFFINIIGDMLTNLADFSPFVSGAPRKVGMGQSQTF